MNTPNQHPPDDADLHAPPKLVSALQKSQPVVFIPKGIDYTVLRAAERHFRKPTPNAFPWLRLIKWGAAAAAIALLCTISVQRLRRPLDLKEQAVMAARRDVNHDGVVDILDAFALARKIQAGDKSTVTDINGDRVVDQRDVAALAARAVKLNQDGPS